MKAKKSKAAASPSSLVLEITTDTTGIEASARTIAKALLGFAAGIRASRLAAKRKRAAK